MAKGQAERLLPMIEALLASAGLGFKDLTALGVGTGPGNFTGVRISVAFARGLSFSLGVPAIGVTRLEALAFGLPRPVTVVDDARRDSVYFQTFGQVADGFADGSAAVVAAHGLRVDGPVTGNGSALIGREPVPQPVALIAAIARIAAARAGTPQAPPAPFYLRGADAAPSSDPKPVILDA